MKRSSVISRCGNRCCGCDLEGFCRFRDAMARQSLKREDELTLALTRSWRRDAVLLNEIAIHACSR